MSATPINCDKAGNSGELATNSRLRTLRGCKYKRGMSAGIVASLSGKTSAECCIQRGRDAAALIRSHGDLSVDKAVIRLFLDFTLQVQRQRKSFDEVKKVLRPKEVKYTMLFPAELRVLADRKSWYFASPEKAWKWFEG
ncbi:hypothetical protein NDU88_000389 [Pleurodeles waltl]|uniref:Uncharacterized protein n=1 Tax=Pleurodeles waltl TaxID=8319 RepID=A0AAV7N9C7_PLEWA|nr:hypothetical protein NDU88_000389 [Pleurodeles waltl]